jgi:hypothetical protein
MSCQILYAADQRLKSSDKFKTKTHQVETVDANTLMMPIEDCWGIIDVEMAMIRFGAYDGLFAMVRYGGWRVV